MTLNDIKCLIANHESRRIEYKQSIAELDKLGKAICGFLNDQGGTGFIGITDKRVIQGLEVTESTKNKLANLCNHFDPWPHLNIEYIPLPHSDKQVVVIHAVPRKDGLPFAFKGTPYLRNEAQLKKMPVDTYKQRLLAASGFSTQWENLPTKSQYTLDDLDTEEILRTVRIGLDAKRIPESINPHDPRDALIALDLMSEAGELTQAAMVLFAKSMPADYMHCFLRMGRFIDETMNDTLDSKQLQGNLFQLLNEAEAFVQKHLPISSRYAPNQMTRIDEPALPFLAVREAIINALVHRDYAHYAGDVSLLIFNTHLEIHNIGHLMDDMTVEQLKTRHPSRRRNRLIANVCYIRQLIERYGSGTLRMIALCKEQGLPPPEFSEAADGLLVKFFFKAPIGPQKEPIEAHTDGLSDREKNLLDILAQQGQSTLKTILAQMDHPPTDRTVRSTLSGLREKGLVGSQGHGRGAVWFLLDNAGKE